MEQETFCHPLAKLPGKTLLQQPFSTCNKGEIRIKGNGIDWSEIPYAPYSNRSVNDATGLYINYLQHKNVIFIPAFGLRQDATALNLFEQLFPENTIIPIISNEIAKEDGVLNCISWNIYLP